MVDFLGIGAQKSGTSWTYACLFEHPEICIPVKEIRYFSGPQYHEQGQGWYESYFRKCDPDKKKGEFSTSYLYSPQVPARIFRDYPMVRLIAILRNPVERAYSQYGNAIKTGEITTDMSFDSYIETEPSCLLQGIYSEQLERYFSHFESEQLLILCFEEISNDPLSFIQAIYRHIGVDDTFSPPSMTARINVARVPRHTGIDISMRNTAEFLRRHGFGRIVHMVKRSGLTDAVRGINTDASANSEKPDLSRYREYFAKDIEQLSILLGRDMQSYWNM